MAIPWALKEQAYWKYSWNSLLESSKCILACKIHKQIIFERIISPRRWWICWKCAKRVGRGFTLFPQYSSRLLVILVILDASLFVCVSYIYVRKLSIVSVEYITSCKADYSRLLISHRIRWSCKKIFFTFHPTFWLYHGLLSNKQIKNIHGIAY